MNKFRDLDKLDELVSFFEKFNPGNWHVSITGGEPFLMPNFGLFCRKLGELGNTVSISTNLSIPVGNWINEVSSDMVEFLECTYQPESKKDIFFSNIVNLVEGGYKPLVRFVSHPKRLEELSMLKELCDKVGVGFMPTTLFSRNYPLAYTDDEKKHIQSFMTTYSSLIQLESSLDTTTRMCWAGTRYLSTTVNGDIRPCQMSPLVLGNLWRKDFVPIGKLVECMNPHKACYCDLPWQLGHVVEGVDDSEAFQEVINGHSKAKIGKFDKWIIENEISFINYSGSRIGGVTDDTKLILYNIPWQRRLRRLLRSLIKRFVS